MNLAIPRTGELSGRPTLPDTLADRVRRVAETGARHAADVDRDACFPADAVAALKRERLLGILVPGSLGGEDASVSDVADLCYALGRACSSAAMIFAMHSVKVACILHHGYGSPAHDAMLRRIATEQLLLASSTTEGQSGGDVRVSEAAIQRRDGTISLIREASVISYGEQADAIVTTARRASDAAASDQVLAVFAKADYELEPSQNWNTLGMRGTCSGGFKLTATGVEEQILPVPYASIHKLTMVPAAHLFWSAVWTGIAAEAVERARRHIRKVQRAQGAPPPAAIHFTRASGMLRQLRMLVLGWAARFEAAADDPEEIGAIEFQTGIHQLKVDASELAVAITSTAMRACGLSGYRNDGDASIGRLLRDVLSAPIMISNDRLLASLAAGAVLPEVPALLRD
jgi:acyl-CoA dehydrogenase